MTGCFRCQFLVGKTSRPTLTTIMAISRVGYAVHTTMVLPCSIILEMNRVAQTTLNGLTELPGSNPHPKVPGNIANS